MRVTRNLLVKVQMPPSTNDPVPKALVYDREKSVQFQTPIDANMRRKMGQAKKDFFYATIEGSGADAKLVGLGAKAGYQDF